MQTTRGRMQTTRGSHASDSGVVCKGIPGSHAGDSGLLCKRISSRVQGTPVSYATDPGVVVKRRGVACKRLEAEDKRLRCCKQRTGSALDAASCSRRNKPKPLETVAFILSPRSAVRQTIRSGSHRVERLSRIHDAIPAHGSGGAISSCGGRFAESPVFRKCMILNGSGSRTRTYDPRINSPLLYQLSYAGVLGAAGGGR